VVRIGTLECIKDMNNNDNFDELNSRMTTIKNQFMSMDRTMDAQEKHLAKLEKKLAKRKQRSIVEEDLTIDDNLYDNSNGELPQRKRLKRNSHVIIEEEIVISDDGDEKQDVQFEENEEPNKFNRLKKQNQSKRSVRQRALDNMRKRYGEEEESNSSSGSEDENTEEEKEKKIDQILDDDPDMNAFVVSDDIVETVPNNDNETQEEIIAVRNTEEDKENDSDSNDVPPVTENPKQFLSQVSTLTPRKAYGVTCQYLISCLLDSDFENSVREDSDNYFASSIKKVFNNIEQQKESLVGGTVWSQELISNLQKLLLFHSEFNNSNDDCEVCRRTKHPVAFKISLTGPEIDGSFYTDHLSSEPEFSEDQNEVWYNAGRHCFKRLVIYHVMHHYKYLLVHCLKEKVNYVRTMNRNSLSDSEILNTIDRDYVEDLYQGYKNMIRAGGIFRQNGWMNHDEIESYEWIINQTFPTVGTSLSLDSLLPQELLNRKRVPAVSKRSISEESDHVDAEIVQSESSEDDAQDEKDKDINHDNDDEQDGNNDEDSNEDNDEQEEQDNERDGDYKPDDDSIPEPRERRSTRSTVIPPITEESSSSEDEDQEADYAYLLDEE
jgi:hypothetical protein